MDARDRPRSAVVLVPGDGLFSASPRRADLRGRDFGRDLVVRGEVSIGCRGGRERLFGIAKPGRFFLEHDALDEVILDRHGPIPQKLRLSGSHLEGTGALSRSGGQDDLDRRRPAPLGGFGDRAGSRGKRAENGLLGVGGREETRLSAGVREPELRDSRLLENANEARLNDRIDGARRLGGSTHRPGVGGRRARRRNPETVSLLPRERAEVSRGLRNRGRSLEDFFVRLLERDDVAEVLPVVLLGSGHVDLVELDLRHGAVLERDDRVLTLEDVRPARENERAVLQLDDVREERGRDDEKTQQHGRRAHRRKRAAGAPRRAGPDHRRHLAPIRIVTDPKTPKGVRPVVRAVENLELPVRSAGRARTAAPGSTASKPTVSPGWATETPSAAECST